MLAYQPVGPKVHRLLQLVKKYSSTHFACLIDDFNAAKNISETFAAENLTLDVYIDLNVGMNRTGIEPTEQALTLYVDCDKLKGINIIGLHVYDGHIRDTNVAARKQKTDEAFQFAVKLADQIRALTQKELHIVAGGSPTFPIHAGRVNIECSPGTFVFWDKGYTDLCPEQNFLTAAVLVTRVISLPSPTRICTDLGHKSVAAENEIGRRVFFLNASGLTPVGQSEEHLVCETASSHHHKTGDVLYGLPYHVCPTVALYERVYIIENGKVTGEWKNIARDRKVTI